MELCAALELNCNRNTEHLLPIPIKRALIVMSEGYRRTQRWQEPEQCQAEQALCWQTLA